MPTINLNISITVPEGADVAVTVDREDLATPVCQGELRQLAKRIIPTGRERIT